MPRTTFRALCRRSYSVTSASVWPLFSLPLPPGMGRADGRGTVPPCATASFDPYTFRCSMSPHAPARKQRGATGAVREAVLGYSSHSTARAIRNGGLLVHLFLRAVIQTISYGRQPRATRLGSVAARKAGVSMGPIARIISFGRRALLTAGLSSVLFVAVGCNGEPAPVSTHVLFECASPTGAWKAVYWVRSGGGAAGWVEQVLTVVPAAHSTENLPQLTGVFNPLSHAAWFTRAYDIQLTWKTDDALIVGFPDTAVVLRATPGGLYTAMTPQLKITYHSVQAESEGTLAGGNSCGIQTVPS